MRARDAFMRELATKHPTYNYIFTGHTFKGPYKNKKLSNESYLEFANEDMAYLFCEPFNDKNTFKFGNDSIVVKQMAPKLQRTRNYYMGEALKLILAKSPDCGAAIKWEDRSIITPDKTSVFQQPKKVVTGEFLNGFTDLSFTSK